MRLNMIHAVALAPAYKALLGTGQIPKFLHCCHDTNQSINLHFVSLGLVRGVTLCSSRPAFCHVLGVQKGHLLTNNL